jgi:hypothetical protein
MINTCQGVVSKDSFGEGEVPVQTASSGGLLVHDRNKVNYFKQDKMQQLIDAINNENHQPPLPYDEILAITVKILTEFKVAGMQMLVFKHKEHDVQKNTLILKSIL